MRFIPDLPFAGLRKKLSGVAVEFGKRPGRLALCFALSVAVQATFVASAIVLARTMGVDASAAQWFFAWPLAKIVAILPISLAGLGVREAALASFLAPFGASAALVVAVSLVWQSIFIAGALVAGLFFMLASRRAPPVVVDRSTVEPQAAEW